MSPAGQIAFAEAGYRRREASGAPIGQVDDHALFDSVDRGERFVDEAPQTFGEPVIAPGLTAIAVHALLDHDPVPVIGDDEAMEIKVKPVLDGRAVDLGDKPTRPGERCAVETDPITDRDSSCGVWCERRPRPPQIWIPSSPDRGVSPRFRAPMTLVVTPEECQSIPITAPNDWNQNGCANRRSSSSRPYSRTMASVITAPSRVMRLPSHFGTWPAWSGKSAVPARRAISARPSVRRPQPRQVAT